MAGQAPDADGTGCGARSSGTGAPCSPAREAGEVDRVADRVDGPAAVEFTDGHRHPGGPCGPFLQRPPDRFAPARLGHGVGVEDHEQLVRGYAGPVVDAGRVAGVGPHGNDRGPRACRGDNPGEVVGGSVVNDDDLVAFEQFTVKGGQGPGQVFGRVPRDYHH